MTKLKAGKFAIFEGDVGIIVNTDVPIDEDGKPTNPVGTFVSGGVEQIQSHKETKYRAVEWHPIINEGDTKMRLIEDVNGQPLRVETDVRYLVGDAISLLEILEPNDERIPESRRAS